LLLSFGFLETHPAIAAGPAATAEPLPPILDVWDFGDPAGTQLRFESLAREARNRRNATYEAEAITQVARCLSLRSDFSGAHATLDAVERTPAAGGARVRIRVALERGRTINSSGDAVGALPFFEKAAELARGSGDEYLELDAIHMAAIVAGDAEAEARTALGRRRALEAQDQRARHWLGPLHNNLGWRWQERGRFDDALDQFRLSEDGYAAEKDEYSVLIARYAQGRALRGAGRSEEAVRLQESVRESFAARGEEDGYVLEELALGYLDLGQAEKRRATARRAHEILSEDGWFRANAADRLARLEALSQE